MQHPVAHRKFGFLCRISFISSLFLFTTGFGLFVYLQVYILSLHGRSLQDNYYCQLLSRLNRSQQHKYTNNYFTFKEAIRPLSTVKVAMCVATQYQHRTPRQHCIVKTYCAKSLCTSENDHCDQNIECVYNRGKQKNKDGKRVRVRAPRRPKEYTKSQKYILTLRRKEV